MMVFLIPFASALLHPTLTTWCCHHHQPDTSLNHLLQALRTQLLEAQEELRDAVRAKEELQGVITQEVSAADSLGSPGAWDIHSKQSTHEDNDRGSSSDDQAGGECSRHPW
jgi:hypothetical protein